MSNLGCFTCLSCGKVNPVKGHSYTNKYCNNSCQQEHQRRNKMFEKVQEWKESKEPQAWAKIPDWIKQYLIQNRGHACEVCDTKFWNGDKVPLDVIYKDGDSYNNKEDNLQLICPNCRAQRKIH
jgi:membrane-associated HD superfamily phosphohydrolase